MRSTNLLLLLLLVLITFDICTVFSVRAFYHCDLPFTGPGVKWDSPRSTGQFGRDVLLGVIVGDSHG